MCTVGSIIHVVVVVAAVQLFKPLPVHIHNCLKQASVMLPLYHCGADGPLFFNVHDLLPCGIQVVKNWFTAVCEGVVPIPLGILIIFLEHLVLGWVSLIEPDTVFFNYLFNFPLVTYNLKSWGMSWYLWS